MQKLIIIRGHSGSGKSTFAEQKILAFQSEFPLARVFHIENDHFLMTDGNYLWTKARFQAAKQQATKVLGDAFAFVAGNPTENVLIVVSNVGGNIAEIQSLIKQAMQNTMQIEIYRMQNFFRNRHGVSLKRVLDMYLLLERTPIEGEIRVPAVRSMNSYLRERLQTYLQNFPEKRPLVGDYSE